MKKVEESELIQMLKDGNRSAMSDLYSCHIGFLSGLCSRYLPDRDEMKDTLQNSFIKIFTSIDKFQYRGPGSLKAWMSRIVVNESLKTLAAHQKSDKFKDDFKSEVSEFEDIDPDTDNIPTDIIQKMIQDLPDGYRTIFNLYVFEEMSHKEIGKLLGITESTSASQLHRAKNLLAGKIKEYRKQHNI